MKPNERVSMRGVCIERAGAGLLRDRGNSWERDACSIAAPHLDIYPKELVGKTERENGKKRGGTVVRTESAANSARSSADTSGTRISAARGEGSKIKRGTLLCIQSLDLGEELKTDKRKWFAVSKNLDTYVGKDSISLQVIYLRESSIHKLCVFHLLPIWQTLIKWTLQAQTLSAVQHCDPHHRENLG